jgi:hypothetical protein
MKSSTLESLIRRAIQIINSSTFDNFNVNPNLNYYLDATLTKARRFNDAELAYAVMVIIDDDNTGTPNKLILTAKKALDEDETVRQLFSKYGKKFKTFISSPKLDKRVYYLSDLLIGDEDELNQEFKDISGWYQFINDVGDFIGLVDDIRFEKLRSTKSYSYA